MRIMLEGVLNLAMFTSLLSTHNKKTKKQKQAYPYGAFFLQKHASIHCNIPFILLRIIAVLQTTSYLTIQTEQKLILDTYINY